MPLLRPRNALLLLCAAIACVCAEKASSSIAAISIPEIEEKLQVCSVTTSRDLPFIPCPGQRYSNTLFRATGLSPRARSQYLQSRDLAPNFNFDITHLRCPLSWLASRQRPTCNIVHLWAPEFPPSTMSAEHRSLELVCHGGVRCGRIIRGYAFPSFARNFPRRGQPRARKIRPG